MKIEYFKKALNALDPWIALHVSDANIPVFALAAHSDEGTIFNRVYKGDGQFYTPSQNEAPLFGIGSGSKPISVAAIVKLVEQGRLRLSDRFLDFFPEINVPKSNPLHQATVLDLARHQGGMAALEKKMKHSDANSNLYAWFQENLDSEALLRKIVKGKLNDAGHNVGKWDYSSLGIAMLGLIVERVSGKRYEEYVNKNLLAARGVHDVFPSIDAMRPADRERILQGHNLDKDGNPASIVLEDRKVFNPTSGYVASAAGIASFYHQLLTGKMLSSFHTAMLHQANIETPERGLRQALGVTHRPINSEEKQKTDGMPDMCVGHPGFRAGNFCITAYYERIGLTLSIMANATQLPPDLNNELYGSTVGAMLEFMPNLLRKLQLVSDEARQNERFDRHIEVMSPLLPLRRPSIRPGFNPEANLD